MVALLSWSKFLYWQAVGQAIGQATVFVCFIQAQCGKSVGRWQTHTMPMRSSFVSMCNSHSLGVGIEINDRKIIERNSNRKRNTKRNERQQKMWLLKQKYFIVSILVFDPISRFGFLAAASTLQMLIICFISNMDCFWKFCTPVHISIKQMGWNQWRIHTNPRTSNTAQFNSNSFFNFKKSIHKRVKFRVLSS